MDRLRQVIAWVKEYQWDSKTRDEDAERIAISILNTLRVPFKKTITPVPCQYSKEALEMGFQQRQGMVIGESKDSLWRVLWNGIKTPYLYYKDYIELTNRLETQKETEA
jgi:hypothetical protein